MRARFKIFAAAGSGLLILAGLSLYMVTRRQAPEIVPQPPVTAVHPALTSPPAPASGSIAETGPAPAVAVPASVSSVSGVPAKSSVAEKKAGDVVEADDPSPAWIAELVARARRDPAGTLAYCHTLPKKLQRMAFQLVFTQWVQSAPEEALRAAQALSGDLRQNMVDMTMTLWAQSHPDVVMAQLDSVDGLSSRARNRIALDALVKSHRDDPAAAIDALANARFGTPDDRDRMAGYLLGQWIVEDGAKALAWMRDSNLDDATYDRAIVFAVRHLSGQKIEDAAVLFEEFVGSGRMDDMMDKRLYREAVLSAKILGAAMGGMDYSGALAWGFELPPESAAQAYVLSNVAFSQTHGQLFPDVTWIAELDPGFVRARTIATVAYGRLMVNGDHDLFHEVKRQLDHDQIDPARLRVIVQQSKLPPLEKQTLLGLM